MTNKQLLILAAVAVVGIGAYVYFKKKKEQETAATNGSAPVNNSGGIVGAVGGVIDTVSDAWNDIGNIFATT